MSSVSSNEPDLIQVSAVVLRDSSGAVLTVRKTGTSRFMFPGGKPEIGESAAQTAVRECAEELDVQLDILALRELGTFRAAAANEEGSEVEATVFEHPFVTVGAPAGEIEQLRWLDIAAGSLPGDLAPLLAEQVVPALRNGRDRLLERITVFTGSATGTDLGYQHAVVALGEEVARRGIAVVYGGGRVGLMGQIADAALRSGGDVIGVMPQALVDGEIAHTALTRLDVVGDMHQRKTRMAELGDAFVALPGGAGTLEEFFEVWTWQQLGIHDKPVALYNVSDFWSPLLQMIDHMVDQGFLASTYRDALIVSDEPGDLVARLQAWRAPAAKWKK